MTSFLNGWRNAIARRAACTAASGSSPFTWKTGAWMILAHVAGIRREAVVLRRRGEADLVVDDDVDRAAGAIAVELGEPERLGDDALAGERGVAVHEHRHHAAAVVVAEVVLLGAHDALDDRIDRLEVARVRASERWTFRPERVT